MATYIEYITDASVRAAEFAGKTSETLADFVAEFPEFAGNAASTMGDYLETSFNYIGEIPETSGQFAAIARDFIASIPRYSYEASQAIISASSRAAEAAGEMLARGPSYFDTFVGSAADYSAAAAAAAAAYLANRDITNPLNWIQKQDDGIYVNGAGGTSGGSGASGSWAVPYIPKYPEGVPLVPPQIIPDTRERIKKFRPPQHTQPKGCVNKREPTIGEVYSVQPIFAEPPTFDVFWFDNICYMTQEKQYDHDAIERTSYTATPCGMPAFADIALFAGLPNGRYAVQLGDQNAGSWPMTNQQFYELVEGWYWEGDRRFPPAIRSHSDEYHECLAIEFHDYSGLYFERADPGWNEAGYWHAIQYTHSRARLTYLGEYPPVVETPTTAAATALAVLPAGLINMHIFRAVTLLGGLWEH